MLSWVKRKGSFFTDGINKPATINDLNLQQNMSLFSPLCSSDVLHMASQLLQSVLKWQPS